MRRSRGCRHRSGARSGWRCCARRPATAISASASSAGPDGAARGGRRCRAADAGRGRRAVAGSRLGPGPGLRAAALPGRPVSSGWWRARPYRGPAGHAGARDRAGVGAWTASGSGSGRSAWPRSTDVRPALGTSFARPVLVRIHRAAGGNPFYALEIGREMQRRGVPPPSQPLPVPGDHRDLALLRLKRLPRATRDALARVAAMARPSTADLDLDALAPAEVAGIVRVTPAAGPSSPIRCSRRPCTPRSRRPAAAGCTGTSRSGPPARRNGPAIWPWRPTGPTRPPRRRWTRRPPRRRRTAPRTWPWS